MLLVITRPECQLPELLREEADTVIGLFEAGLGLLHIRKPHADFFTLGTFIKMIPAQYRHKLVVHPPRMLENRRPVIFFMQRMMEWMDELQITRIHIGEWLREALFKDSRVVKYLSSQDGMIYSTGIHHWATLSELAPFSKAGNQHSGNSRITYNYVLVSPVFNSSSKPGYLGNPALRRVPVTDNKMVHHKFIAMGGVKTENLHQIVAGGYVGAALLGSIWPVLDEKTISGARWHKLAIDQFKQVKVVWENIWNT